MPPNVTWRQQAAEKRPDHCHSGARATPASPETMNIGFEKSWAWPVFIGSGPGSGGPSRNDSRLFPQPANPPVPSALGDGLMREFGETVGQPVQLPFPR
jgi:hypothetical protein